MIKFIDASNPLSVQVHPFDDYAYVNENEFGKNEMWYVMDARPGAFLYCGFSKDISRQELERRIGDGTIEEVLNKVPVQTGDVVFIPAGTVHAIGAGILICEIQQNSNSTYRVYDYNRRDAEGNLRPLHIKKALDVISTAKYEAGSYGLMEPETSGTTVSQRLCLCKYFECTRYCLKDEVTLYLDDASFVSLVFLSGQAKIRCQEEIMDAAAGDSFFVSAGRKVLHVEGHANSSRRISEYDHLNGSGEIEKKYPEEIQEGNNMQVYGSDHGRRRGDQILAPVQKGGAQAALKSQRKGSDDQRDHRPDCRGGG